MAHGLAGIKEMRLDAYAEVFARAGYNVFVFDYRHFGESGGSPRQLLDIKKQLQDWRAAIYYVTQTNSMDASDIILWGSSLSGGHVMEIAAQMPKMKAVIAQVPHVNGLASGLAAGLISSIRLTFAGLKDVFGSLIGRAPLYVNASGQPGELALMTAPGEVDGYLKLVPEGRAFEQQVAARFALQMSRYNPGKKLKSLTMPTLVQVGLHDKTTPARATTKACKGAKSVELKTYSLGHFEPYVDPVFPSFVADQVAFLDRVTGAAVGFGRATEEALPVSVASEVPQTTFSLPTDTFEKFIAPKNWALISMMHGLLIAGADRALDHAGRPKKYARLTKPLTQSRS